MRKGMWQKLRILAQFINQPWFIWGDFNAIMATQDRVSRHEVTMADIQDFADLCSDTMTTEIPWRGDYFTWTNGQMGVDRVISKIDRALGNGEWMMKFGHLTVEVGDPFISEHSPLSLRFERRNSCIKIPFRFLNVWADHEAFQSIVTKGDAAVKIEQARREIIECQQEMKKGYTYRLRMMEKAARDKLEKWSLIEEKIF
ncbi:PREDICTED: uncharacterized protein LOC109205191 [Nicotiana attenuata]|uniref:uncharacterized protein LOC109205191 n=1 Tax=Nicotiana attenuata TaxID=49451 RepID=UPI00090518D4|nr:PREDICTED: uncharacterized protein LOC109205191 [Nicotiana attenuata]